MSFYSRENKTHFNEVKMKGSHKETHSKLKANYNDNRDKPLQYCSILNTL